MCIRDMSGIVHLMAVSGGHLADVDEISNAPAAARRMLDVSSDLFRAQQTAHAFADLMGLDVELDLRLRCV